MVVPRPRLGLTVPVVVSTALLALLIGGVGSTNSAGAHEQRGSGGLFYASMLKRPDAPNTRKHILRLFTRGARDDVVRASKRAHQATGTYRGQNNGFEEWRIKPGSSGEARRLVRTLVRALRSNGRVRFHGWTYDPTFPKPSIIYTCKLAGFNRLGSCHF